MAFTEGLCPEVQQALNATAGDAPSIKRTQLGYLEALESDQNTAGVQKVAVDPGTGKKKTVQLTYIQRASDETTLRTSELTDCSTSVEPAPFEQSVEITSFLGTPGIKFDRAQMRKLCAPDSQYMSEQVNAQIDLLMRGLNKKLITAQAAAFGTFLGGDTYKAVALLKGNNGSPNYKGEAEILEYFADLDVMGKPIVVGAGNLAYYMRQTAVGGVNQDGINVGMGGNMDFFRDRFVEPILGDNAFIGLVPGMVQLLTWNKYVGAYAADSPTFSHGTIVDPKTGLTIDMRWHFNDCDDTYSLNMGLWYKLHTIPTNAFAATDDLFEYNGSLKFVGVQQDDYGCCV